MYGRLIDVPVELIASGTSVTARWYSREESYLRGYEVALVRGDLVSGTQPPPVWRSAPVPRGCAPVEVTFDGLQPGGRYLVWLHARIVSSPQVGDGETWEMVGESPTVELPR